MNISLLLAEKIITLLRDSGTTEQEMYAALQAAIILVPLNGPALSSPLLEIAGADEMFGDCPFQHVAFSTSRMDIKKPDSDT